jgi:hypothetical protein
MTKLSRVAREAEGLLHDDDGLKIVTEMGLPGIMQPMTSLENMSKDDGRLVIASGRRSG